MLACWRYVRHDLEHVHCTATYNVQEGGSLPYASGKYISVWMHSGRMQTIVWLACVPCVYYLNRLSVLVRLVLIALFLGLWSESLQYMDTTNVLLLLWRCIKATKVKGNSEKKNQFRINHSQEKPCIFIGGKKPSAKGVVEPYHFTFWR